MKQYQKDFQNQITFPLGGIGSGSIGFAGNGALVDPEIRNVPDRDRSFGNTHFAIRAEAAGKRPDCRILCGDVFHDFMGTAYGGYGSRSGAGYGYGLQRNMEGFRHFKDCAFSAAFPFASVQLSDDTFPGSVILEAFNPFIPSNDADSSLPAAFFSVTVENDTGEAIDYTVALSLTNILGKQGRNEYLKEGDRSLLTLYSGQTDPDALDYGNLTVATAGGEVSYQEYWYRQTEWFFNPRTVFLNDLGRGGKLQNRTYDTTASVLDTGTLALHAKVGAKEKHTFRFLLSWFVPNGCADDPRFTENRNQKYRNYYTTCFTDSKAVARYCLREWDRMEQHSRTFSRALAASNLPPVVYDAIQGNLAILKSTTFLRLESGDVWAWEGVERHVGSCMGNCRHVYAYSYALAFLFPALEKKMRQNELNHNMEENGKVHFRTAVDLSEKVDTRACADGQMSEVFHCYREWKLSGDTAWLASQWEKIKRCLEYAWQEGEDSWDPQKTGLLTGRQHHTLDLELFGTHAWLTGFYHLALQAGAEMADAMGESKKSAEYRRICAKGQQALDEKTFRNGYFVQDLDWHCAKALHPFFEDPEDNLYWDKEHGQIRFQPADACEIDQVLADYHADLLGLPPVFLPDHRRSALQTIYETNFLSMRGLDNPCRVFAANDEKGVVMCVWKDSATKPELPLLYAQECMTGFEYAYACNLLQCGMEKEALEVIQAIRDRYDGKKRNPFAEIECGAGYGRAMASYSLLLTYSGFRYDLSRGMIGFCPVHPGTYFWSVEGAWGLAHCTKKTCRIELLYGEVTLQRFITAFEVKEVILREDRLSFAKEGGETVLSTPIPLTAGDTVTLQR